jgi:hypothetical protein
LKPNYYSKTTPTTTPANIKTNEQKHCQHTEHHKKKAKNQHWKKKKKKSNKPNCLIKTQVQVQFFILCFPI